MSLRSGRVRPNDRVLGTGAITLAILLVSPDALVIRSVAVDSWTILLWRSPPIAFALLVLARTFSRRSLVGQFREAGTAGVLVTISAATSSILWVIAINETAVSTALVIFATAPLFAALLAWLVLRERLAIQTWVALVVASLAVLGLVGSGLDSGALGGNFAALGATLALALTLVLMRKAKGLSMLPAFAASHLLIVLVAWAPADTTGVAQGDIALLVMFGVFAFSPGIALLTVAPRLIPAGEVALIMPLETVLGSIWAWIWLAEQPTATAVAGGTVVIGVLITHSFWALRTNTSTERGRPEQSIEASA